MYITALYAALLAPLFLYLSGAVARLRWAHKVAIGDGGNKVLLRAIRVHANFAEYCPFALLLLAFAESLDTATWLVHALGISLVIGRCFHAYGVTRAKEKIAFRVCGISITFIVIAIAALAGLYGSLPLVFGN